MAKPSETREKAQKIVDEINAAYNSPAATGSERYQMYQTAAIITALLYVGDQLGYLNSTLDTIEHHAQRIGG